MIEDLVLSGWKKDISLSIIYITETPRGKSEWGSDSFVT